MKIGIYHITKEDAELYKRYLPQYILDHVALPGYYALAAVTDAPTPAGTAMYYLGMLEDGSMYGRICCIDVKEEQKHTGVGSALLQRIHQLLKASKVEESYACVPQDDKGGALSFFRRFSYAFDSRVYEYQGSLEELLTEDLSKWKDRIGIRSIGGLKDKEFPRLLQQIMDKVPVASGETLIPAELAREQTAYDQRLSCFYHMADSAGIFLVRRTGDLLEPLYLAGYGEEVEDRLFELLVYSARIAKKTLPPETRVGIEQMKKEDLEYFRDLCPVTKPLLLRKGMRLVSL
ncbi:MAG: GNAT family N-acetyltransferase [Lachnospiraceae bacterium]|nr:GNAT family N-acetyltransferase [Lachnospiraceae bacterium]